MEKYIRLNATVVSNTGIIPEKNKDNFYMNGRFIYEHETGSIQVSFDNEEPDYIFVVMDSMEKQLEEKNVLLSMTKELRKFHRKAIQNESNLVEKTDQLKELAEEVSNLIFSSNTSSLDIEESPSMAGLLIEDNTAMSINNGSTKIYLLRDGNFEKIAGAASKTESMLKMGIITDEQANLIDEEAGENKDTENKPGIIRLKENDMFLMCTDGVLNAVDEEQIFEIMSMRNDTGVIANMLIREAIRNSGEDNCTAMVIRVDSLAEGVIPPVIPLIKEEEPDEEVLETTGDMEEDIEIDDDTDIEEDDVYEDEVSQETDIDRLFDNDEHLLVDDKIDSRKRKKLSHDDRMKKKRLNLIKRIISLAVLAILVSLLTIYVVKWISGLTGKKNNADDLIATTEKTTSAAATEEATVLVSPSPEPSPTTAPTPTSKPSPAPTESEWPKSYTVKAGDTLYKIARAFYNNDSYYKKIMEANNITNPNHITVGQKLIIPKVD
jgi:serine/threonine protein phosphatase PrpC/LysM repeat protein